MQVIRDFAVQGCVLTLQSIYDLYWLRCVRIGDWEYVYYEDKQHSIGNPGLHIQEEGASNASHPNHDHSSPLRSNKSWPIKRHYRQVFDRGRINLLINELRGIQRDYI